MMLTVTIDQSEGISGADIPEQAFKKMRTGSASLSLPSPRAFFAFLITERLSTTISEPGTGYFAPRPLTRSFWLAPFSPLFSSFNMRFREQNIRSPEENACTAGYPCRSSKRWGHVPHYRQLMSRVWPVNTLFQTNSFPYPVGRLS